MVHQTIKSQTDTQSTSLAPKFVPSWTISSLIGLTLIVALVASFSGRLPDFAAWTVPIGFAITLALSIWVTPKHFTIGFLTSMLPFLIAWRAAAMNHNWAIMIIAFIAFLGLLAQLTDCIVNDQRHTQKSARWINAVLWQFAIIRMYFGFNEIGHSVEKIFSGSASFNQLFHAFFGFGLTNGTGVFVVVAGLLELAVAIGIGFGFLTRAAGVGGVIYLLVATVGFGHEWAHGYGWSTTGGGWEYIMLLIVFFGSFAFTGASKFSIDGWLIRHKKMPRWLIPLALNKAGAEDVSKLS